MDEQLKNLKFSTKSIMLTDKQKEFIREEAPDLVFITGVKFKIFFGL